MTAEVVHRRAMRIFCITAVLFVLCILVAIWSGGNFSTRFFQMSGLFGGLAVVSGITAAVAAGL